MKQIFSLTTNDMFITNKWLLREGNIYKNFILIIEHKYSYLLLFIKKTETKFRKKYLYNYFIILEILKEV